MTEAEAVKEAKTPKAARRPNAPRGRRCPGCPFCAPSRACLDPTIRSGRCGEWVFYLLRGKQHRHLFRKPRDPRTPSQLHWRARLSAASRKYSQALTDEQQDACIAAGAKRRSRPRLAQTGPLTGQQWWVGRECAEKSEGRTQNAETAAKGLQTQGVSLPTWEPHRSASVVPPEQHRGDTRRESLRCRESEARNPKENRMPKAPRLQTPPAQRFRALSLTCQGLSSDFDLRASDLANLLPVVRPDESAREGLGRTDALAPAGQACSRPKDGVGGGPSGASGGRQSRLQRDRHLLSLGLGTTRSRPRGGPIPETVTFLTCPPYSMSPVWRHEQGKAKRFRVSGPIRV